METNIDIKFIKELNEFLDSRSKEEQDVGVLNCQIFCLQKSLEMKQNQLEAIYAESDDLKQKVSRLEGKIEAQESTIKTFSGYYNAEFYQMCPTCGRPVAMQLKKENRPN